MLRFARRIVRSDTLLPIVGRPTLSIVHISTLETGASSLKQGQQPIEAPAATHPPLVASFTARIDQIIDAAVNAHVADRMAAMRGALFPTASKPLAVPTPKGLRLCPVPGCGKPAAGPRYHWKCRDHGGPLLGKKRVVAPVTPCVPPPLPVPKTPAVIPPEVTITRLPPGPVPAQRAISASRTRCRVPGCLTKNSGPRYDLFCRDHYAQLNTEERAKMKAMWKVGQASA